MTTRLYEECGISYAYPEGPKNPIPSGMIELEYHWHDRPSGEGGSKTIYVYSKTALWGLLEYWNKFSSQFIYYTKAKKFYE